MSKNLLKVVSDGMTELGLEYEFGEYTKEPIVYPYFVGEYTEAEPMTEDGLQETAFMLSGFSRGTWLTLENAKAKIENYFNKVYGKTVMVDDGSAVAVFYGNSLIVPTGDEELKKIQINLQCKEWKVS
jgi:hypothetical protein|nr:MAG TPA: hypothetical protein [Caudoviricetes sp.]